MEHHAGEAHAAGPAIVEGLIVPEQLTSCRPDRMQHCIGRGKPANPIAVTHAARPSETSRSGRTPRPGRACRSSNDLTCS